MTTLEFYPADDVEPDTKQSYPGSFTQQRLWILSQMDRSIDAYVITRALRLRGPLDLPALTATLDGIMARHEMLRTRFEMHDGALRQIVEPHISAPLTQSDVSGTADPEAACRAFLEEELAAPFALSRAPLWRVRLCKLGDGDWVLALIVHHIIADAWSMELLQQELALRYQAHVSGAELALPAPRRNYGDYAAWQRSPNACEAMEEARNYWMEKLADPELLELPSDMPGPRRMLAPAATLRHAFDPIQVQALKMLATDRSSSLFMALTALVKTLLYRYCGQRDITVGTPVAGRDWPELETVVGLFMNVVALRDKIDPGDGFTTLLDQVARTAYEAFAHQNYSLEHLIDDLDLERDAARAPLFDVLIALQNVPAASSRVADLQIGPFEAGPEAAKYDLIFEFAEDGDGLILNLIYSTGLFSTAAMTRLCSHLERLLERLLSAPEAPIGTLSLLTRAERAELAGWAGGDSAYPREASLADLFGEIVAASPDAPALRFGETTLTYTELDDRAGRLAAYIDAHYKPEPGAVIGLCLERGIDLVVAMLAILKTGGAYLPLDPDLPAERLGYMIEEAKVGLVLSQRGLAEALPEGGYAQLLIDNDAAEIAACDASVPSGRSDGGSLAYVMYTSGSTGRPKGVMVPQRAVTRLVRDTDYIEIKPGDRIAQAATPAFDAATFEIWGALLNGAAIELLHRDDVLDPDRFAGLLREQRFNIMFLTTALFNRLAQIDPSLFGSLDTLLFGGEAVDPRWVRAVLKAGAPKRLLHVYGPTECTTFATAHPVQEVPGTAVTVPIGSPIANTVAHILDPDGQPVPAGIPGELHLGGDGLADGYLDQPELTNQRFILHPVFGRLYKTGDLCRWNQLGAIDYLGRTDHQIKLRGFRIELGEIEATLRNHANVEEAVALLAGEGEHRRIVAYVTGEADAATLRRDLHAVLPSYMVPSEIIVLEALPLTVTGKLDRRALPEPSGSEHTASGAPATPGEELLAGLWASVLKRDAIGRADSFFDLGGHSLLATQLLSRIRTAFGTNIALRLLFEHPTLAAQAAAIEAERRGTPPPPIVPRENRGTLPLSFAQQRLWFLAQLEGSAAPDGVQSATYNVTAALGLDGALDETALRAALCALTARHESLRMNVRTEAGQPVLLLREAYDPLIVEDLALETGEDRDAVLRARAAAHAAAPFDLATEPLLRLTLLRIGESRQVLLVNLHHIAADGWSLGVLVRDLSALYAAALADEPCALPPLPVQYADYAAWQRDWLSGAVLEQQIAYWRDRLADAPALLELPADRPRPATRTCRGGHRALTLAPELTDRLEAFSRAKGVTLFMTLLAGFKTLLHRYSGQQDILVGSPIANRTHAQTEELVGFFVNTLVLRSTVTRETSFEALLSRVRETALDAYAHQDLPFETLVNELQPERSLSHSPLFQVMFALQNAPQEELRLGDAVIQTLAPDLGTAKFDLTLSIEAGPQGLTCNWEYAGDLFDPSRIDRMAAHYSTLLESLLAAPEAPAGTLPLLTEAERAELAGWAGGAVSYPREASLADLFGEIVAAAPDAPALRLGKTTLSYTELDDRAGRLAAYIDAHYKPEPGAVIGLCLERGIDLVVAMLAILKTGGAYLPLDPDLPAERLGYMIEEAKVGLVLSQRGLAEALPEGGYAQLLIDNDAAEIAACDASVPSGRSDGGSLAYVMYTSGSTGRPKGVMVPQRAVTRLVRDTDYIEIKPGDRIAQAATPAFDAATFEIWGALLNGAAIELLHRDDVLDPDRFAGLLREQRFNIMFLTTALFNRLAQIDPSLFGSLDTLLFGGEAVDPRWVRAVLKAGAPKRLLHVYGPTECTTFATAHPVQEVPGTAVTVPIGSPIANTVAHILDPDGQPVPAGIPGELHLGGDGLADGYLDQPELTNQRFILHPVFGRLYKTGDLCRWNQLGAIDYLGRTDHQIKLRGFRIELGEIEAVLRAQECVEEAVVILHEVGDRRRLVAYASRAADAGSPDRLADILQAHMATALPDYMVPAQTIVLDTMPLNANGKIDRHALPEPSDAPVRDAYEEPRTEREIALALVWCNVLGRARIGRHDNFFELGGDSILSIQIVAQARAAGLRLAVRDLFEHQTIAALAPHAATGDLADAVPAMPRASGPAPLTPVQSWFFSWDLADKTHFNQALMLRPRDRITLPELEAAGHAILDRHAALRLQLVNGPDGWRQDIAETAGTLPVHHEDLRDLPPDAQAAALTERASHWQGSLDPEHGPVMRLVLFDLTEGQRLLWCIHHLAVDGVSWRILLDDLESAFAQTRRGTEIILAPASASFLDWAQYLQTLATSPGIAEEAAYWRDWEALPPLPKDHPDGIARWDSTAHVKLALDRQTTTALLEQAPRAFGTRINDLLLTALAVALEDWTGRSDWPIALESHGRPEHPGAPDTSETVGWFTAITPVRLELPDRSDLAACLKAVKEQLRAIPGEGLAHGIGRYLTDSDPAAYPEPEIAFNYLGQFEQAADGSFFTVAGESAGESQCLDGTRPHAVDINGLVSDGALTLSLSYGSRQYRRETMEQLAAGFETALRALVDLCRNETVCGYTPSDFPLAPVTQDQLDLLATEQGRGVTALYPLSPMQLGLAFHSLSDAPGGSIYFEQLTWKIGGPFDADSFHAAWDALLERHQILRTALWLEGDQPLQFVRRTAALPWRELDWRALDEAARENALEKLLAEERSAGFDLTRPPLLRCVLIRMDDARWQFVLGFHHLLLDGWGLPILFRDLMLLYGSRAADLPAAAPYEHYIAWLEHQDEEAAHIHWRTALAGFDAPTPLPCARSTAPDANGGAQQEAGFTFEPALGKALIKSARERHLTLSTLFNAAWALVLSRTSGEREVTFGVTLSGRDIDLAGIEDMVGLFINTVPMRVSTTDCPTGSWLDALQVQHQENSQFGYVPLADIQRDSGIAPGMALFDSLLVFENYPLDPHLPAGQDSGAHFSEGRAIDHTNYPLTLIAAAYGDEIRLRVGYDSARFDPNGIERIVAFLTTALRGLIDAEAEQPLDRIGIVSAEERAALWHAGRAQCRLPVTDTLISRFASQAAQHPDRLAVTCADASLTYGELDARAEQIARHLQALGARPDHLVGLLAERSVDLIAGLLGIVKSGAAYLPIDPATPAARAGFMLEDAGAIALVTERVHAASITGLDLPCLYLDDPAEETVTPPAPDKASMPGPDHMAYVIYTSGSTGQPKGVMVSHANVLRLFDATATDCAFSAEDVWTMFHSVAFDFSVWEIWGALLHGGRVVVVPDDVRHSPAAFHDMLENEGVTILNQTPSAFRHLIPEAVERGRTLALRMVIFGGEALDLPGLKPWFSLYGEEQPRLVNMYGITETTVHVTWCPLREGDCSSTASLIGRPLRDLDLHLLDDRGEPVPDGMAGEIHVGGAGLARGYLNRPALTAERFIDGKVEGTPERLYRSGDLARRRPDGGLEYLGRIDKQVKLRGYRIEIGEIEATLSQHPAVRQVAVIAQQDQGRLIAYLVCDEGAILELRDWAAARLPAYMVPALFVPLECIPLTRNGKTDHRALPEPDAYASPESNRRAPQTDIEQRLVEIWREVLGVGTIGIDDDFFSLGGHSLKALQVVSRTNRDFGIKLPIALLLKHPTIAALAPFLGNHGNSSYAPIRPVPEQETYPLSHAQKRFWLEDRLAADARYNMPAAFELQGPVDAEALHRALEQLIARHETLRTIFVEVDGEPRQRILGSIDVPLKSIALDGGEDAEARTRAIVAEENRTRFSLEAAPLFRVTLITRDGGPTVFVLVMHHIIGDGWSMEIFYRELLTLYRAARDGTASPLPPLTIQYRDYAMAQDRRDRSEDARFWAEQLDGLQGPLRLPHDLSGTPGAVAQGNRVRLLLSEGSSTALRALSHEKGTTPANTLLALFKLFLFQLTRQQDICVGMAAANRGRPELEPLLGAFVNLLPLRTRITPDLEFGDLLDRVTRTSADALDHQDYPYDLILRGRGPAADNRDPVNVIYAYQNAADIHPDGAAPTEEGRGTPHGTPEGPDAKPLDLIFPFAKVDLMLLVEDPGSAFALTLEYDAGLFTAETAERHLQSLNRFAEAIAAGASDAA